MKTKAMMPDVENKLFGLIYLCGLKSQETYNLEKGIGQKVRKTQRKTMNWISRTYKTMQTNQDKCFVSFYCVFQYESSHRVYFLATVNDCLLELFVEALTRKQTDLVLKNIQDVVQVETMKGTIMF